MKEITIFHFFNSDHHLNQSLLIYIYFWHKFENFFLNKYPHLPDKLVSPFIFFKNFLHPACSYCTLPVYCSSRFKCSAACPIIVPAHSNFAPVLMIELLQFPWLLGHLFLKSNYLVQSSPSCRYTCTSP